jgi:hypothetical protein
MVGVHWQDLNPSDRAAVDLSRRMPIQWPNKRGERKHFAGADNSLNHDR